MENRHTNSASYSKPDRKTIEKNRRNQMKNLFTQLNSLVPHQEYGSSSRENMSLPEQVGEATEYIKKLQAHLERLKEKKSNLGVSNHQMSSRSMESSSDCGASALKSPQIEVHVSGGSALQVVMITGLDCHFIFTEAIRVIHDEGAEVVNASFSVVDDTTVIHTIHAKIKECLESDLTTARITERLNGFCAH